MRLIYNGITLSIIHFLEFGQRAVYSDDGADYLYTHFTIEVQCVFNPRATASQGGQPQNPPAGVQGDGPALSVETLRHTLLQARQRLRIDIGGQQVIGAPSLDAGTGAPYPCDANNGPRPVYCSVVAWYGIQTAVVRYRIECWLNECPSGPSNLLSNRWAMTETVLEDYSSQLDYEGTAVVRADYAAANVAVNPAWTPDVLRWLVLPPVKVGFQRVGLQVGISTDGLRLNWSCRDEQPIYYLAPNSGIYRVRGHTEFSLDWTDGLLGVNALRLPAARANFTCEAWGRRGATRDQVALALVNVAASALGLDPNRRVSLASSMRIDFPTRHGTLRLDMYRGGWAGGLVAVVFAPNVKQAAAGMVDFPVPGVWSQGGGPQVCIASAGPGLYSDAMLRVIAQTLLAPCTRPAAPPVAPDITF